MSMSQEPPKQNCQLYLSVGGFSVVGENSVYSVLYVGLLSGWDIYKTFAGFGRVMVLFIRIAFP